MIRAVLAVVLFIAIAVAAWWLPTWLDSPNPSDITAPDASCRPLSESCQWSTLGGPAEILISPLTGGEFQLDLQYPEGEGKPFIILTGETMFMGEYPMALQALDKPGHYRVRFVPPFCTTGDQMVWRVSLRAEGDPVTLPFRLLFSPAKAG